MKKILVLFLALTLIGCTWTSTKNDDKKAAITCITNCNTTNKPTISKPKVTKIQDGQIQSKLETLCLSSAKSMEALDAVKYDNTSAESVAKRQSDSDIEKNKVHPKYKNLDESLFRNFIIHINLNGSIEDNKPVKAEGTCIVVVVDQDILFTMTHVYVDRDGENIFDIATMQAFKNLVGKTTKQLF